MPKSYAMSALTEKRAELSGIIVDLENRIRQVRADLSHIDAAILLFDPEARPTDIGPRLVRSRSSHFGNGEMSRFCRDALRVARGQSVSAESIVRQAMTAKGLDPEDAKLRRDLIQRFLGAMHRMQTKGTVVRIGRGLGARWTLPTVEG